MKVIKGLALLFVLLILSFISGPKPSYPAYDSKLPTLNYSLNELDNYIATKDADIPNLKPNNESRLIWADSTKKTPYSLVYLHGFSASPMEGDPTHREFAKRYGMNCYIPRLAEHGINDKNSFKNLTPKALIDDAKEAIAIGHLIGEKVIVMSCSTGSTLSIYLAANNSDKIHSLIMYSPNIRLANEQSKMLTKPWGLQIARKIIGETRKLPLLIGTPFEQYTTTEYKVEGVVALQYLLHETMTAENFSKIKIPFMAGYYYKDKENHDEIVSIDAIKEFGATSATDASNKKLVAFPNVDTHVIPSSLYSKDTESVLNETYSFAEEVLGLKPVGELINEKSIAE